MTSGNFDVDADFFIFADEHEPQYDEIFGSHMDAPHQQRRNEEDDDIVIYFSSDNEDYDRIIRDTLPQPEASQPLLAAVAAPQNDQEAVDEVANLRGGRRDSVDRHSQAHYSPDNVFFLRQLRRMDSPRYRVSNIAYTFRFLEPFLRRVHGSGNAEHSLERGFDTLITHLRNSEDIHPTDIVTLYLENVDLQAPVCVPFVRFRELTGDMILRAMEHVAQSNTSFTFGCTMTIKLHIVRDPAAVGRGNGRLSKKQLITLEEFSRRKTNRGGSITKIQNRDNLCLGRAIAVAVYLLKDAERPLPPDATKTERRQRYTQREAFLKDARGLQTRATKLLYERAGLRQQACVEGRPSWEAFQACLRNEVRLYVHTITPGNGPSVLYAPHTGDMAEQIPCIDIFWWPTNTPRGGTNGHYDCINSVAGLYGHNKFCRRCLRAYKSDHTHACTKQHTCRKCGREGKSCLYEFRRQRRDNATPGGGDQSINLLGHPCRKCRVWFPTRDCHATHIANRICGVQRYWCPKCKTDRNVDHECLQEQKDRVCRRCKSLLGPSHLCHMSVDIVKEEDRIDYDLTKYIFYDFESMCDENGKHIPNLCVLQLGCGKCMDSESEYLCESCPWHAERKTKCLPPDNKREIVIVGPDTETLVGQFFSQLVLSPPSSKKSRKDDTTPASTEGEQRNPDTPAHNSDASTNHNHDHEEEEEFKGGNPTIVVVAHYAKGYDNHFILKSLLEHLTQKPEVILSGSKILNMSVGRLIFRDSHNYIPTALSKFCETFGLEDGEKGYFPHLYNKVGTNQTAVRFSLPPKHFYGPDIMSRKARKAFLSWYRQNKRQTFDMQVELLKYCRQDVSILRRGCAKFINIFLSLNDVNPFYECITLPHACMLTFRRKYLRADTIAIIPPGGYEDQQPRRSKICAEWLGSLERDEGLRLDREVSFTCGIDGRHDEDDDDTRSAQKSHAYKVDGYDPITKTVYEFLGCFWHGCTTCFPRKRNVQIHYGSGTTLADRHDRTMYRLGLLREHPEVSAIHAVWECRYKAARPREDELPDEAIMPLRPRDAFYGGRTNGVQLHKKCGEGEKIRYADVCSLYPYVCKRGRFPVSHPRVIRNPSKDELFELDGLVKCDILPPRRLYHPLLPYRANGKLYFPLCRACAETNAETECRHSDDQRSWVGTYTTIEVRKAVRELGYEVRRIYSAWHFSHFEVYDPDNAGTPGLFADYVNNFYKLKQEASGYPSECQTEDSRRDFVEQVFEKEGVLMDPSKIEYNPGMRAIAKFMLNSHWGKFGQSNDKVQCQYITNERDFYDLFHDKCVDMKDVVLVSPDTLLVTFAPIKEHRVPHTASNPVVAAWVTAQARLKLYEALECLGDAVLYFDTDSVIYVEKENNPRPLKLGDSLGEWTDEIEEGNWIDEFVTCGPKNYAYRLHHRPRKGPREVCKIRGFTLNYHTSNLLNFRSMARTALPETPRVHEKIRVTYPHFLKRAGLKRGLDVHTVSQSKDYGFCYSKRRIIRDPVTSKLTYTVPYGYDTSRLISR